MRPDPTTTATSVFLSLLTLSSVALAARPKDAILLSEVPRAEPMTYILHTKEEFHPAN